MIVTTESSIYLAANVRAYRERRGISQISLAEEIGWEQSRLSEIENANADRKLSYVDELSRALGVPVHELLRKPKQLPEKLADKLKHLETVP